MNGGAWWAAVHGVTLSRTRLKRLSMGYIVHGILQARIAVPFSRRSSQPRDRTQISRISGRFFTIPPGKPKNIGVGSLSILQRIFPTQESNPGLLHCRRILYQLSYQNKHKKKTFLILQDSPRFVSGNWVPTTGLRISWSLQDSSKHTSHGCHWRSRWRVTPS